jgi:hypothetical protein
MAKSNKFQERFPGTISLLSIVSLPSTASILHLSLLMQQAKPPPLSAAQQQQLYEQHVGGSLSFRQYMHDKKAKLSRQFTEKQQRHQRGNTSNIFAGVVIHVNGLTSPSATELRQMMAEV